MSRLCCLIALIVLFSGCNLKTENCLVHDVDISGKYLGECLNGLAEGMGEARGRDTYIGTFKAGNPHGKGNYKWGAGSAWNGDMFVGEFRDGERKVGEYRSKNGIVYKGHFYKAKLYGFGTISYPSELLIDKNFIKSVKKKSQEYEVMGFWKDDKLLYGCDSDIDCENLWAETVQNIEIYLNGKNIVTAERDAAKLSLLLSKCLKNNVNDNDLMKCIEKENSLYVYTIAYTIAADAIKKGGFNDLDKIKAGMISSGEEILTVGVGNYVFGNIVLTSGAFDLSPIMVNLEKLAPDRKLIAIRNCNGVSFGCKLIVMGVVKQTGTITAIEAKQVLMYEELEFLISLDKNSKKAFKAMNLKGDVFDYIKNVSQQVIIHQ